MSKLPIKRDMSVMLQKGLIFLFLCVGCMGMVGCGGGGAPSDNTTKTTTTTTELPLVKKEEPKTPVQETQTSVTKPLITETKHEQRISTFEVGISDAKNAMVLVEHKDGTLEEKTLDDQGKMSLAASTYHIYRKGFRRKEILVSANVTISLESVAQDKPTVRVILDQAFPSSEKIHIFMKNILGVTYQHLHDGLGEGNVSEPVFLNSLAGYDEVFRQDAPAVIVLLMHTSIPEKSLEAVKRASLWIRHTNVSPYWLLFDKEDLTPSQLASLLGFEASLLRTEILKSHAQTDIDPALKKMKQGFLQEIIYGQWDTAKLVEDIQKFDYVYSDVQAAFQALVLRGSQSKDALKELAQNGRSEEIKRAAVRQLAKMGEFADLMAIAKESKDAFLKGEIVLTLSGHKGPHINPEFLAFVIKDGNMNPNVRDQALVMIGGPAVDMLLDKSLTDEWCIRPLLRIAQRYPSDRVRILRAVLGKRTYVSIWFRDWITNDHIGLLSELVAVVSETAAEIEAQKNVILVMENIVERFPETSPQVLPLLSSPSREVRDGAMGILKVLGPSAEFAISRLEKMFDESDDQQLKQELQKVLSRIRIVDLLAALKTEQSAEAVGRTAKHLGKAQFKNIDIAKDVVSALLEVARKDVWVPESMGSAMEALGILGGMKHAIDAKDTEELTKIRENIAAYFLDKARGPDDDIKVYAVRAILNMGDYIPKNIDIDSASVIKQLKNNPDDHSWKFFVAKSIEGNSAGDLFKRIQEMVSENEKAELRRAAAEVLAMAGETGISALLAIWDQNKEGELRRDIFPAFAQTYSGDSRVLEIIEKGWSSYRSALSSPLLIKEPRFVVAVLRSIETISENDGLILLEAGKEGVDTFLKVSADPTSTPEMLFAVAAILENMNIRSDKIEAALRNLALHRSIWVRQQAEFALASLGYELVQPVEQAK